MHDNHERHDHIPPPDEHRDKDKGRLFKPIHVVLGALVLIAILVIYIVQIAKAGY